MYISGDGAHLAGSASGKLVSILEEETKKQKYEPSEAYWKGFVKGIPSKFCQDLKFNAQKATFCEDETPDPNPPILICLRCLEKVLKKTQKRWLDGDESHGTLQKDKLNQKYSPKW